MAFTRVNPGDPIQAHQLDQVVDALNGGAGAGQPVALTSLTDASNYALTVQNDEATNSRALLVLKSDGTQLIKADVTGVTLGSPLNLPTGSITSTYILNGTIQNVDLGPDVARANLLTNGGFEIWQRSNGPFTATGVLGPDQWRLNLSGSDTLSVSADGTNVDTGSARAAACTYTRSAGTNTVLYQQLKLADYSQIRGRLFSLSVRVRTSTPSAVTVQLTTDGTSPTSAGSGYHSGGGTYETLSIALTGPVVSDATYLQAAILFAASCTAYVDNACLVVGSQPANYVPIPPFQDLAQCERYFEVISDGTNGVQIASAQAYATQNFQAYVRFRTWKAVTPTLNIAAAGNFSALTPAGSASTVSALPASSVNRLSALMNGTTTVANLVAGNVTNLSATAGGLISAEANP